MIDRVHYYFKFTCICLRCCFQCELHILFCVLSFMCVCYVTSNAFQAMVPIGRSAK